MRGVQSFPAPLSGMAYTTQQVGQIRVPQVRAQQASKGAGPRTSVHTKPPKGCQCRLPCPFCVRRRRRGNTVYIVTNSSRLVSRRTHAIRHKPSCCRNVSILSPRILVTCCCTQYFSVWSSWSGQKDLLFRLLLRVDSTSTLFSRQVRHETSLRSRLCCIYAQVRVSIPAT